jgi:hypothetical protein
MADDVFVNGRAVVHKDSAGQSTAFPDVCLCPPTPPAGPVPTPLPNMVKAADLSGGASSVLVGGNPVGKQSSFFKQSTGNESSRPTGGGVVTHGVQGQAHFQTYAMNVMFEGEPAVRHLDLLTHNHMAQMPGNTPPAPWVSTMAPPEPMAVAPQKKPPRKKDPETKEWKIWIELDPNDPQSGNDELVLVDGAGSEVTRIQLSAMATQDGGKVAVFKNLNLNGRYSLIREYAGETGGTVALFIDFTPNELDDFCEGTA